MNLEICKASINIEDNTVTIMFEHGHWTEEITSSVKIAALVKAFVDALDGEFTDEEFKELEERKKEK